MTDLLSQPPTPDNRTVEQILLETRELIEDFIRALSDPDLEAADRRRGGGRA